MAHGIRRWVGSVAIAAGLIAAASTTPGCSVDNPRVDERDGDPAFFAAEVQPALRRHCAFEGCHGREGMPLSLYAVDFLRLRDPTGDIDPDVPVLDERTLREAELTHNRRALAAHTSPSDPTGQAVISRLIPPSEGGIAHGDTVVFDDLSEPDLDLLTRFLAGVHAR